MGFNNFDGIVIKYKKGLLFEFEKMKYEIYEYYISKYDIVDDVLLFFLYIVFKDFVVFCVFLVLFIYVLFFVFEMGGKFLEYFNFEIVNLFKIFEYIFFVWYFILFYVVLKVVFDKLFGVLVMFGVIVVLFVLFWLDCGCVKLWCYCCGLYKVNFIVFVIVFIFLGYLGGIL